jgi:hypothetical protein
MKKLRPAGDITEDIEPLLYELSIGHKLQHSEVLHLIHAWLKAHVPEQEEPYTDGHRPIMQYGHPDSFKRKV